MVLNLVHMSTMLSAASQESYFPMVAYMFLSSVSMNPKSCTFQVVLENFSVHWTSWSISAVDMFMLIHSTYRQVTFPVYRYYCRTEGWEAPAEHCMSKLVPSTLSHLAESHLEYFRHWCHLLHLESSAECRGRSVGGAPGVWLHSAHERSVVH